MKKFPGARCLFNRSFTSLAFALLADGVPADKLYPMDIERAFRKLDQIKPHIKVWWTQGNQSQQLIGDGEVDMIAMWNARAQEMIDRGAPLKIVWNGAENYGGYWYAPKGTPRAKLAFRFLEFVSHPRPQADFRQSPALRTAASEGLRFHLEGNRAEDADQSRQSARGATYRTPPD